MTGVALWAILSHWWRQPLQLSTLLVGLALATALWSAVQAINAEARSSYDAAAGLLGGSDLEELHPSDGDVIGLQTFADLRQAGWNVSPVLEGTFRVGDRRVRVLGLEPFTAPPGTVPPEMVAQLQEDPGTLFLDRVVFAAPETLVLLTGAEGLGSAQPAASLPPDTIVTDISVAADLLDRPDQISRLIVHPNQPPRQKALGQVAPDLVRQTRSAEGDVARLTDSFHLNLTAFGLLSFAVGLFIVHAAIGLAFEQRRAMFRTLRAVGLPLQRLLALLLGELLVLALVAGSLGIILGYLIAGALLPDVAATLRGLYGARVSGDLAFRPAWAAAGLGIAVLGTLVAAANGLWAVARMPLLASAQSRAWARTSAQAVLVQGAAGACLLVAGLLATVIFDGLLAGFGLLGGLLLGAALMLPLCLHGLLWCAGRLAKSASAEWFWADTSQQLRGLSLALMALLLALATNIGVGTMVSSFRLTFLGWLDQRLASELYVSARSEEEAAELRGFLAGKVDALLPIWSVDMRMGGLPGQIYGIIDHATYRHSWPLLEANPTVWEDIASDKGILVSEQLARRGGFRLGDQVEVEVGWPFIVVGIYSDYGNPTGQAVISNAALLNRHPDVPRLRYGVRIPPDQTEAVTTALTDEFSLSPGQITNQAALKQLSVRVFEQTFAVTGALNVLTLAVAGFAIFTSLLTLAALRLPQLAPVWALGMTRATLARLELARSVVLAIATFLVAIPTGLALAWALLAVVNVEAFGWRLPMHVFPLDWVRLGGLAVVAALLAVALPVRRLRRTAPAAFLKVFANER
ncbi:MAG: FtsX-like permease family protein [Pseudomonadota bacterium]